MKLTADTNLLVRLFIDDDPAQAETARRVIADAVLVAIPVAALCELVWVLRRAYRLPATEVAAAIRALAATANAALDDSLVAEGLAQLDRGGDFADAIIARQGATLGGEVFCSFDRRAVALVEAAGLPALVPA